MTTLARQRALGRDLIACLNRRDAVRGGIARLTERLDALHDEQDRIERELSAADAETQSEARGQLARGGVPR